MNKREYLRSLGFNVGERGRLTDEMLTALKSADLNFDGNKSTREIVEEVEVLDYPIIKSIKMREPRSLYGYTKEGFKVGFSMCFTCSQHMMYCECKRGITAPSAIVSTKEPDVILANKPSIH